MHFAGVPVAPWIRPRLAWARKQGWTGKVTSGYRSSEEQRELYLAWKAGRRSGPVAAPGSSNHELLLWPGGAVDVTDADRFNELMKRWPGKGPALRRAIPGEPWHFSNLGR
jgi:hypothetical protein